VAAADPLPPAEIAELRAQRKGHFPQALKMLNRAFRIAGAQAVLASHWPVSNAATQALMKNFIAHWQAGMPRAQALRRAQRELRQSEDHSSPYFWAAFTLTGQWR
jgi:CHAT domain-containing protein